MSVADGATLCLARSSKSEALAQGGTSKIVTTPPLPTYSLQRRTHEGIPMRTLLALTIPLLLITAARAADTYKPEKGPLDVTTVDANWNDPQRPGGAVTVPVKMYYPKTIATAAAPMPLIIFSHGLGGSRDGYSMWAQHWASYGYIVILPTHFGSDTIAVLEALQAPDAATTAGPKVMSVQTALRRVQDVSFLITRMTDANAGKAPDPALALFKGKVDVKNIGMAGHSFGALTTLMIAGENEAQLGALTVADPRVTAAIAMSPQPSHAPDQKKAFATIKIPVLHLTGTLDDAPLNIDNVKAADRRIPFDNSTYEDTALVTFTGATHMTFSARALNPPATEQATFSLIRQSTTAFWDAHLKSDPKAAAWLKTDFPQILGAKGKLETKPKPQPTTTAR